MSDKRSTNEMAKEAAKILSYAEKGQENRLVAELNKIKPQELSEFAKELDKLSNANLHSKTFLPKAHITDTAETKTAKDQPVELAIETQANGKPYSVLGLRYDQEHHKWHSFDFLAAKAKTIEDLAAEKNNDIVSAKIAAELNKIPERALADFVRSAENVSGDNSLRPEVAATEKGVTKGGGYEPTQIVFESKLQALEYSVNAFTYDPSQAAGHRWSYDRNASTHEYLHRLPRHSNYGAKIVLEQIKETPGAVTDGALKLGRFFSMQELIDRLNQMSRQSSGQ
jgi:hypothetical protein